MSVVKKYLGRWMAVVAIVLTAAISFASPVRAADATNYTFTVSEDGEWIRSQDAYVVAEILMKNTGLSRPGDIYVKNGHIYIADSGNARIVIQEIETGMRYTVGEGILDTPNGIFVTDDGTMYIADTGACAVFKLNAQGELIKSYERPTTATFGKTTKYTPSKVVVNSSGIMYIVSEGAFDGIIQLNQEGEFLGYFGYNNNPMSIGEYLQDIFFTDAQKEKLFNRVPASFYNLAIDPKGVVYTVTQAVEGNALKRHNIAGTNLFPSDMLDENNFVDVIVGNYGQIYAITQTGLMFEYSTSGVPLFSLGGLAIASERNGLITTATGIAADESGNVYVLDGERGLVHVLCPTEYAASVHKAMKEYDDGHYKESREMWEGIAVSSGRCYMVEDYIGDCFFQLEEYDEAAKHYRIAEDRSGYSEAYWQIRNEQSSNILPYVFGIIVILIVFNVFWKFYRKKHPKQPKEMSKFAKDMHIGLHK